VVEKVAGRVPVLVDGGIRRGTDIIKAFALGASAVQIGRPYLWGLGISGAEGVTRVVEILRKEFEIAMALTGTPDYREYRSVGLVVGGHRKDPLMDQLDFRSGAL